MHLYIFCIFGTECLHTWLYVDWWTWKPYVVLKVKSIYFIRHLYCFWSYSNCRINKYSTLYSWNLWSWYCYRFGWYFNVWYENRYNKISELHQSGVIGLINIWNIMYLLYCLTCGVVWLPSVLRHRWLGDSKDISAYCDLYIQGHLSLSLSLSVLMAIFQASVPECLHYGFYWN